LISLTTVISCSNSTNIIQPDAGILQQPSQNNVSSLATTATATSNQPLFVDFNNAYKMLYTDNEQIGLSDPKNPDKYLLGLVVSAKATIDAAVYDIDNQTITDALIAANKRGVKVRIMTDTDNMTDKDNPALPRKQIVDLKNAGIEVKEDHRSGIMHQKFLIVDNKTVWTGSMNLTSNAMYRDNNNVLKIESTQLAADYNEEFKRMFEQNILGPNAHQIPFPEVKVGDASIKLYFSPKGGTKAAVIEELSKSQHSIKFMTFSLTDPAIKDLVLTKKAAGLQIEGVMDECLSRSQYSLIKPFKAAGLSFLRDGNQALLHHKVIIIDDQTVITGSFNYSDSAENSNNENTLVIKSKSIASLYNKEYSRVKYAALNNKNVPSYDNPACGSGS